MTEHLRAPPTGSRVASDPLMFLIRDAEPRILIEDIGAFDVGARPFYFWVNAHFTAASNKRKPSSVIRL